MNFFDAKIRNHLLAGGIIKRKNWSISIGFDKYGQLRWKDRNGYLYEVVMSDLKADDWKITRPMYDYEKIIRDKVLCLFWDIGNGNEPYIIGTLDRVDDYSHYPFIYHRKNGSSYECCEPFNPKMHNVVTDVNKYVK